MSEPDTELGKTEDTLEQALSKNWAAMSDEAHDGDEPSIEAEAETEAGEVQESEDALEPPEKWTDEQKESFRSLSPDAQRVLLDRHRDVESYLTKESQSLAETRKRYERLDEVFKPYDELARQGGIDLTPHIAQAMQWYFSFQKSPLDTVRNLIQTSGLRQDQLFEDESVDPDIRALRNELQTTRQELEQLKGRSQTDDEATIRREVDAFKDAKNEDGSLKHPYWEQLRALMAPLVAQGESLEAAYNRVLWTLPEYQKSQLESQRKAALKEQEANRQTKVEKAKKAGDTLPSSDADKGAKMPKVNGNWEKALQHTLEQLRS